jgi:septal ring factor EnvC (AmiA/AmiB activator)
MASDQQQSPMEASTAALTVRVDSLTNDIMRVGNDVRALSTKIDNMSKPVTPQYTTWLAGASLIITLMVGYFSLGISPIKEAIAKNDQDSRSAMSKVEHEIKTARKENDSDLKDVRSSVVPRGEHEQRWRSFENTTNNLAARIDETRKTLSDLYSPKDAFKDLQKQIDDLRLSMLRTSTPNAVTK